MKYIPRFTHKDVLENHKRFTERVKLYKKLGLDFTNIGEFILKKAEPLKNNILEIGTGNGYTALALAKRGHKFISIDNDKESLKRASLNLAYEKLLSSVEFYDMNARSLSFKDESFHGIVIVNFFHHIKDVNGILSEIDRVLCEDGKIIMADFNKRGIKIIDGVHKNEGHIHENSGVTKDYICSYFKGLGYRMDDYKEKHHWILVGEKKIQQ